MPNEEQPVQPQQQQVYPPEQERPASTLPKPPAEKDLIAWEAPERPFKQGSRDFYVKIISIAVLFGVVLFLIDGIMPVLLIIAVVFLVYVLTTVQPGNITYKITNLGVYISGKRVDWDNMGRFWFVNRFGSEMLVVETANITGRMEIMIPADKKEEINHIMNEYLLHEELPATFLDKAANWASRRIPLE